MDFSLQQAIEYQKRGELQKAIDRLQVAIKEGRESPDIRYFLGALLDAVGRTKEAIPHFQNAVEAAPENTDFWYSLGNAFSKCKHYEAAIESFENSVRLKPDYLHAVVNLALAYQQTDRHQQSLELAQRAIAIDPKEKKSWLTYLGTLGHARRFEQAKPVVDAALIHFPDDVDILHMYGNLLTASGDPHAGYENYLKAYEIQQNHFGVLNSIGIYLSQYKNGFDAIPYHQKALDIAPSRPEGYHGLGTAYLKLGSPGDAIQPLLKSIELGHQNSDSFEALILASQYLDNVVEEEIFDLHVKWANTHASKHYPDSAVELSKEVKTGERAIHLGFISPDFRNHSVARFMTCLLKHCVDSGLDVYCYSDVREQNEFTRSLESMGGKWCYSLNTPDEELCEQIKLDKVDVLVDLAGHTGHNRMLLFARKPAPIQISWMGYPNTTGLESVDYRFSDVVADPEGRADLLSTEKLVRLEGGFHCFEPPVNLPAISQTPALDNGWITFGSFNNLSKINALTVRRWGMLLKAVPESKLIIKNNQIGDERNQTHWNKVFENEGLSGRVEFIGYCKELGDHYKTYGRVDIALDTFPYNGTTTTCEALWMGVPVLTIAGNTQRGRTGASLLTHGGLGDWVAESEDEWLSKALKWTSNVSQLNDLRLGLRSRVESYPIGDAKGFAQKFFEKVKELVGEH